MRWIKQFLKDFFSTNNQINENTVMGTALAVPFLIATFLPVVDGTKYYILAGVFMAFFGLAGLKK